MFDLEKYVKLAPFLQFLGLAIAVGGLLAHHHWYGVLFCYVGLFVSFAGFVYEKIYQ